MVKVLGLDPGKQRDSFGIVAVERTNDDKYLVKNAKRFLGKNYLQVEEGIAHLYKTANFDLIILELNNTGFHVYDVLTMTHGLPVRGVYTTKDVKDDEKKRDYSIMDKNEMVRNMIHWFQDGLILFPKDTNHELDELKRQLSIFSEHITEAGNVSYYAQGSEHDDLVMALMLCLHWLRAVDYTSIGITMDGKIIGEDKPKSSSVTVNTRVVE